MSTDWCRFKDQFGDGDADQAFFVVALLFTVSTSVVLGCSLANCRVTNSPVFALLATFRVVSFATVFFADVVLAMTDYSVIEMLAL
jgi:hypothetical protein